MAEHRIKAYTLLKAALKCMHEMSLVETGADVEGVYDGFYGEVSYFEIFSDDEETEFFFSSELNEKQAQSPIKKLVATSFMYGNHVCLDNPRISFDENHTITGFEFNLHDPYGAETFDTVTIKELRNLVWKEMVFRCDDYTYGWERCRPSEKTKDLKSVIADLEKRYWFFSPL